MGHVSEELGLQPQNRDCPTNLRQTQPMEMEKLPKAPQPHYQRYNNAKKATEHIAPVLLFTWTKVFVREATGTGDGSSKQRPQGRGGHTHHERLRLRQWKMCISPGL